MALYNDPRLHLDNRWQPGACADTSPFPLWRPRWAAAGRCRVRACVVASAICCAPIAFFSTSLAFSGFLLSSASAPPSTAPSPCRLSYRKASRGPWALRCSRRRVSLPSVARAQRPQKPYRLGRRSIWIVPGAGLGSGSSLLSFVVQVRPLSNSPLSRAALAVDACCLWVAGARGLGVCGRLWPRLCVRACVRM